jgi:hypothetical protein
MRGLGTAFIFVGVVLCATVIFAAAGLPCLAVGALLKIAARHD